MITFTVAISVGFLDYIIPILGVKKLGGTRSGQIGTIIGLILCLILLGPIGIVIGPFLGALLGEMSTNKSFQDSLKPAFGSFIGVIAAILSLGLNNSKVYYENKKRTYDT